MAITTLSRITETIEKAIDYIVNPLKTYSVISEDILVSNFECSIENTQKEFLDIHDLSKNIKGDYTGVGGKNILAWHIIQSFSPEDNITDEQAHKFGKELADNFLGGKYQYILATHNDKNHLHNHIIFNACSFQDFKKFRTEKNKQYINLREISDEICRENNLTITPYEFIRNNNKSKKKLIEDELDLSNKDKTFKEILEDDLLKVLPQSISWDNFLDRMKILGYEYVDDKFGLGFKAETQKYFTRVSSLSNEFSKEEIEKYLKENKSVRSKLEETKPKNNNVQAKSNLDLIDTKEVLKFKISWRAKLKYCIDYYIFKSNNYDEFLNCMVETGYNIKYGKHISFRCKGMDKDIRAKVLGEEYTEDKIKERILSNNKTLPKVPNQKNKTYYQKNDIKVSIKKLIDINNNEKYINELYYQKYVKRHNTEQMIATDNFMRKYKYNEDTLKIAIDELKFKILSDNKELLALEKDFKTLEKIQITNENKENINKAYDNLNRLKEKLESRIKENKHFLSEHTVVKENLELYNRNNIIKERIK